METFEKISTTLPGSRFKSSHLIMGFSILTAAAALGTIYYSLMQLMEQGFRTSLVWQGSQQGLIAYSRNILQFLLCPAGLLASGIAVLVTSSGVLLHFTWARLAMIAGSAVTILLCFMTVVSVSLSATGPINSFWHDFGFTSNKSLTLTLTLAMALIALMILLIRRLRSDEFKEYFC
ncbi:hypothetical protein AB9P05_03405 [Roseivirga sp. BDSF3-8]|uniref:hypothetical protein n=1 Tax=Roseivirga sp. BDSF3-8 TaxID=3241598 RepID=UPI003531C738